MMKKVMGVQFPIVVGCVLAAAGLEAFSIANVVSVGVIIVSGTIFKNS